jgi:transposase-like protein
MRQVDAGVLQVYLSGANSRGIRWALKPLLAGGALAKSTISRIVHGLKAEVAAWQQRALTELDIVYLYLDGFHLKVRVGGTVSAGLGGARGAALRPEGGGAPLPARARAARPGRPCARTWPPAVFGRLTCVSSTAAKGLRAAVERIWPPAAIQRTVHKLRNLLTAAPKRLHDELRADYRAIIGAEEGAAGRAYLLTCP